MQQVAPIDTGGPVHPGKVMDVFEMNERGQLELVYSSGITLRDHFAGLAMQAFLTRSSSMTCPDEIIAQDSYNTADAMLEARKS